MKTILTTENVKVEPEYNDVRDGANVQIGSYLDQEGSVHKIEQTSHNPVLQKIKIESNAVSDDNYNNCENLDGFQKKTINGGKSNRTECKERVVEESSKTGTLGRRKYESTRCPHCPKCFRLFREEYSLNAHLVRHEYMIHICSVCGWAYDARYMLESHIKKKHQDSQKCEKCKLIFDSRFSLDVHMKSHEENLKCPKCHRCFRSEVSMKRHWESCSQESDTGENVYGGQQGVIVIQPNQFRCPKCPRKFKSDEIFDRHIAEHDTEKYQYKCQDINCQWEFKSFRELRVHSKRHGDLILCPKCHLELWSRETYDEHASRCTLLLRCENCEGNFGTKEELENHLCLSTSASNDIDSDLINKQWQKVECSFCEEIFQHRKEVENYVHLHQGRHFVYKCTECGTAFQTKGDVLCHAYVEHYGVTLVDIGAAKLYKCFICSRRFTTKGRLEQHIKFHSQLKYKCPRDDCGWVFDSKEFQVHVNVYHDKPKPTKIRNEEIICPKCLPRFDNRSLPVQNDTISFSCLECPKVFNSKQQRSEHIRSVHGTYSLGRQHICSLCTREFTLKTKLHDHIKMHELLEWKCPMCGWAFEKENEVRGHLTSKHEVTGVEPMMVHTIYKCSECGMDFLDAESVTSHMNSHLPNNAISSAMTDSISNETSVYDYITDCKCSKCGKNFKSLEQLRTHIFHGHDDVYLLSDGLLRNIATVLKYVTDCSCSACGKTFPRPGHWRSHVICQHERLAKPSSTKYKVGGNSVKMSFSPTVQTKRNDFMCFVCGKTFTSSDQRRSHIFYEHESKRKSSDRKHSKGVEESVKVVPTKQNKDFSCSTCFKTFPSAKQLRSHLICEHECSRKSSDSKHKTSFSAVVPKKQLEGFTIDVEAEANTVWVNVPVLNKPVNTSAVPPKPVPTIDHIKLGNPVVVLHRLEDCNCDHYGKLKLIP